VLQKFLHRWGLLHLPLQLKMQALLLLRLLRNGRGLPADAHSPTTHAHKPIPH
jgi:hypothetical protein